MRGDDDMDGGEAALIEGNVGVNECAETVDYSRVGHGSGSVEVAFF